MSHRLDPLLRPGSIAVVGATEREGSVGRRTVENLLLGRYPGQLYAVNPNHKRVCGVPCYPVLDALPTQVEHVLFAISDARIEAALDDAIAHGTRAVTIMSSLMLKNDSQPNLRQRVTNKVRSAALLVCGGNGMGFYNFRDRVWACGFDTRDNHRSGGVTLISHSGSGMAGIVDVDERIDFNLAVSTGQELSVTMDEYLDFALDQPETRVVGLFMETARNPGGLINALEKANRQGVPIVALKVGRTDLSARLTVSHSGAIAGRDDAYTAVFDRYGVQRVDDMDELATTLIMFAQPHPVADGGLVAMHDSGGERQLLIDLADQAGVPLTDIDESTRTRLEELLDPGLPAVNPLDAWGAGGPDADQIMEKCFAALLEDPGAALGAVIHDRAPLGTIYQEYVEYLRSGHKVSAKPVFLVANRQGTGTDPLVMSATREGLPVLDGVRPFLVGVRCLLAYRDFCRRVPGDPPHPATEHSVSWHSRLAQCGVLDELDATALLNDSGLPMNPGQLAATELSAKAAAKALGYPVVLKTAVSGIVHKTDQSGVKLNLIDEQALVRAYRDLASRLGLEVLVAPMIEEPGVEMMIGMLRDEQFGSLVILGFGGVNAESVNDVAYALPPFDAQTAQRLVDSLRMRPLLEGQRGQAAPALDAFCEAAARFSVMVADFGDAIREIDLNPVIVGSRGCVAVDALVVGNAGGNSLSEESKK
jgi:acyl-CoA synthetase (NDP forming)